MAPTVDPRYTQNQRDAMAMSDALKTLLEGRAGEEFLNIIIDRIDEAVNAVVNASSDMEVVRFRGGMEFGKIILNDLYGKCNVAQEIRRRVEDKKKKAAVVRDQRGRPREHQTQFRRDAL
jgi:hypothetical protein